MTGVLVTGFEPFGDNGVNPSQLIAEALDGVVLPVAYARAADALRAAIAERRPDLVVAVGLAAHRTQISIGRGGFVHVSPLDVLPAETLVHAARVIVRTCAEPRSAS